VNKNRMCMIVCGEEDSEMIERLFGVRVMPLRLLVSDEVDEYLVSIPKEDCEFFELREYVK